MLLRLASVLLLPAITTSPPAMERAPVKEVLPDACVDQVPHAWTMRAGIAGFFALEQSSAPT